jgi:DNA repair exonuclease SbcCD ATPase subunit
MTEDGTLWNIHRRSEKYSKRVKGEQTTEAKTDVVFSSVALDGTKTILNDVTRNETDKEIRKTFGTIDDFLLTSMSSQLDSLSFIREGSTKRKEIFAKFLDLELFDRKFKFAKSEASNLRGALKRLEGKEFASDIDDTLYSLQNCIFEHEDKQSKKDENSVLIEEYQIKIESLGVAINNTPAELIDIAELRKEFLDKRNQCISLVDSNKEMNKKLVKAEETLSKINKFVDSLDTSEHEKKLEEANNLLSLVGNLEGEIKDEKDDKLRNERQASILDGIPCGTQYPSCKFIKDAYVAKANIPDNDKNIESLMGDIEKYKGEIGTLDPEGARGHIEKYEQLVEKKGQYGSGIEKLQLTISKNEALIINLKNQLISLEEKEDSYNTNKEAVDKLNGLISERSAYSSKLSDLENSNADLDNEVKSLYKKLGSLEQKAENLREQQSELIKLQEEYSAYDLYLKCMHSNGIAYDIIKSKLPVINEEISKFLINIVDFGVFFEDDGKRLNIHIEHPEQDSRPLEMGSGAEKTIAAMAIRLALLSVSNLPKGDVFILDEPGTALDEENMEGFTRMLDMIKSHFKTVLLISHLETLKDCVDTQIIIEQKGGHAFVDC